MKTHFKTLSFERTKVLSASYNYGFELQCISSDFLCYRDVKQQAVFLFFIILSPIMSTSCSILFSLWFQFLFFHFHDVCFEFLTCQYGIFAFLRRIRNYSIPVHKPNRHINVNIKVRLTTILLFIFVLLLFFQCSVIVRT